MLTPPPHSIGTVHPDRSLPLMAALSAFLRDIRKPAHLLIAISGGSDSTGLLVGLSSLRSSFPDIRLSAATIDHALRPEAAAEARAVAKLCADLGIFHVIRRWDGEKPAAGISAAAREARYSLLSAIADEIGATAIVTGHTVDDQVETVVMRAGRLTSLGDEATGRSVRPSPRERGEGAGRRMRGDPERQSLPSPLIASLSLRHFSPLKRGEEASGTLDAALSRVGGGTPLSPGLSGMAPATLLDARHWILRPLLHTSRADIRSFLTENGFGWFDDPSNDDPHYERVRVRQAPVSDISAADPDRIAAAGRARAQLAQHAAEWLATFVIIEHAIIAKIDPAGLSENPVVIRHALSTLAAVLGGRPHLLSRENADRLMTFVDSGTFGRMTAGRVVFDRRRDGFYMLRENRNLPHLIVKAGRAAIWDERFLVANHASQPVEILPGIADAGLFRQVPRGLARLAARVAPHVANQRDAEVAMMPRLAPFDRFLPVFDLPQASRIALLMGNNTYLLPPV